MSKTKQEAQAVQKEFQTKMAAIATQVRPRMAAMSEADRKQILAILTPAQISAYKQLLGKPFVAHN